MYLFKKTRSEIVYTRFFFLLEKYTKLKSAEVAERNSLDI